TAPKRRSWRMPVRMSRRASPIWKSQLVEQRLPGRELALRGKEIAPPRDRRAQSGEKARLGFDASQQPGKRRRIPDREIARIIPAEQSDRAVDPGRQHRNAGYDRFGNHVGAAFA